MDMGNREFHTLLGAMLDNIDLFNSLAEPGIAAAEFKERAMQFRYGDGKELLKTGDQLDDQDVKDLLRMMDSIRTLRTIMLKPRC
jgi:hypothetical protein